jgi:hypothetical protein
MTPLEERILREHSAVQGQHDRWPSLSGHGAIQHNTPPPPPMKRVQVIVTAAGWFGPDGKPVEEGQRLTLPADDAAGAFALGRAAYLTTEPPRA